MNKRVFRKQVLFTLTWAAMAIVVVLVLTGCAGPYRLTRDADRTQAVVTVFWGTYEEIRAKCGSAQSIACVLGGQVIVTRKPVSWADSTAFHALGHELFHLLGASHD